jgi:hypothetical protein
MCTKFINSTYKKIQKLSKMKLFALIPLLALATAIPAIKDNHKTTLEMLSNGKLSNGGKFGIVIQRVVSQNIL